MCKISNKWHEMDNVVQYSLYFIGLRVWIGTPKHPNSKILNVEKSEWTG